jgi:tol-pal system protein YbgF
LKDGQYEQAITEFQSFLSQYPSGDFSDNARYWLGEANYATRRYNIAVQEFRKLLEQSPGSSKSADAMLKLGYAYYELGEWDSARKTLTDVTNRHANSTAARLAESRLQKMRLEGR